MSDPVLLNLPSSSCVASVIMSCQNVVGQTISPFTLESQEFKWPGVKWLSDFNMPPIKSRRVASEWIAFALKLGGKSGRFLMGDPSAKQPQGIATGTPLVKGGGQSGNTLLTDGWTPSKAGILLTGDYIQIGTGLSSRLHFLTQDANSNGSGEALLTFEPPLRYSPTDNQAITVHNPRGVFKLVDNTWSWSVSPGPLYRLSFQAEEDVNA